MPGPNHYTTLGVSPSAAAEEIRRAYRALAKQLHPDVNPPAGEAGRFAQVAVAYEILSDPGKRRAYDRSLARTDAAEDDSASTPSQRAHYSWVNIATSQPSTPSSRDARDDSDPSRASGERPPDPGELDELYDTFFAPKPRPAPDT